VSAIRTSLQRAASAVTTEEEAERRDDLERHLWLVHGAVIVRVNDRRMPRLVTMAAEAWAQGRWGKRN
jgi:hypothetical protein